MTCGRRASGAPHLWGPRRQQKLRQQDEAHSRCACQSIRLASMKTAACAPAGSTAVGPACADVPQHGNLCSSHLLADTVLRAAARPQALRYLHGRGLVHRDVKPENLVLARREDNATQPAVALPAATAAAAVATKAPAASTSLLPAPRRAPPPPLLPPLLPPQPRAAPQPLVPPQGLRGAVSTLLSSAVRAALGGKAGSSGSGSLQPAAPMVGTGAGSADEGDCAECAAPSAAPEASGGGRSQSAAGGTSHCASSSQDTGGAPWDVFLVDLGLAAFMEQGSTSGGRCMHGLCAPRQGMQAVARGAAATDRGVWLTLARPLPTHASTVPPRVFYGTKSHRQVGTCMGAAC